MLLKLLALKIQLPRVLLLHPAHRHRVVLDGLQRRAREHVRAAVLRLLLAELVLKIGGGGGGSVCAGIRRRARGRPAVSRRLLAPQQGVHRLSVRFRLRWESRAMEVRNEGALY